MTEIIKKSVFLYWPHLINWSFEKKRSVSWYTGKFKAKIVVINDLQREVTFRNGKQSYATTVKKEGALVLTSKDTT